MKNIVLTLAVILFGTFAGAQSPPPFPTLPPPVAGYPTATTTLNATPTGGSGSYLYKWEQIYGPAPAGLANATTAQLTFTMITPGSYLFRITVMDANDFSKTAAKDYVTTLSAGFNGLNLSNGLTLDVQTVPPPFPLDAIKPVIVSIKNSAGADITLAPNTIIPATATGVAITVSATDNQAVTGASLFVDNFQVAIVQTAGSVLPGSFNLRWNEKTIKAGLHDFRLRVYDAAGNSTDRSWQMTK